MAKGKRAGPKARSSMRRSDDVIYTPFSTFSTQGITSATSAVVKLSPANLGSRCSEIANRYQNYNLERVVVTLEPIGPTSGSTSIVVAGVLLNDSDATNISAADIFQQKHHVIMTGFKTIPSTMRVGRAELYRDKKEKAYTTVAGSGDEGDQVEANVFISTTEATTSTAYFVTISGVIKFSSPVIDGATPMLPGLNKVQRAQVQNLLQDTVSSALPFVVVKRD